jgi:hypothetical protein
MKGVTLLFTLEALGGEVQLVQLYYKLVQYPPDSPVCDGVRMTRRRFGNWVGQTATALANKGYITLEGTGAHRIARGPCSCCGPNMDPPEPNVICECGCRDTCLAHKHLTEKD